MNKDTQPWKQRHQAGEARTPSRRSKDTQPEKQGHPAGEARTPSLRSKDTQPEKGKQDSNQEKRLERDN
jgi:hypothetical protein